MKRALRAPSPAMIVALVALLMAIAGTGYAAFRLPKNSVGTKQLKNGAVTAKKLDNGAVTTGKLKNGAVTGPKMNFSGVTVPNATHANSAGSAPLPTTLPSGRTLTGAWDAEGYAGTAGTTAASAQSFALPLRSAPTATLVTTGTTAGCPGSPANPTARPGNLCLYESHSSNAALVSIDGVLGPGPDPFGFSAVVAADSSSQNFSAFGSWAVTAP